MKRIWKPLDIAPGFRLYEVREWYQHHPGWNRSHIIAASSPTHAVEVWKQIYRETSFIEEPLVTGHALNVSQPADWWEEETPRTDPLIIKKLYELLDAYRLKRSVDGGGTQSSPVKPRTWDAMKHYDADLLIDRLEKELIAEVENDSHE